MNQSRRGNALILVAAVLVLLIIVATVFLSRTSTLRQISASQRQAAFQRDRMESAAEEVAQEIATSLFVHPIDYTDAEYFAGLPVDEGRRKRPSPDASRYGVDERFAWNRAPYEVSPWTNPPDWLSWPLRPGPWREIHEDEGVTWDQANWNWLERRAGEPAVDLFHWPIGATGWPFHATETVLPLRKNPIGGPGTSDTRWLRDIEPQRMASASLHDAGSPFSEFANPFNDRYMDAFSHWRHMSYIGRPQNGWRMCPDIADVTGVRSSMTPEGHRYYPDNPWSDGRRYYGGILNRLDLPIEQWPAVLPSRGLGFSGGSPYERLTDFNTADGDTATSTFVFDDDSLVIPATAEPGSFPDQVVNTQTWDFWDRWLSWLRPEGQRLALNAAEQGVGGNLPPNFYDLSDLDADGVHGEIFDPESIPGGANAGTPRWGERPEDEFTPGTARWNVSRILTDTDGDGFTDSFWWLSPHIGVDGTRQLIGVSITDNSGRINANAATRFIRNDQAGTKESSRGATPADIALVGQNHGVIANADDYGNSNFAPQAPVWNTGFFDIESHQPYTLEVGTTHQQLHPAALTVPMITYPEAGKMTGALPSEVKTAWDPDFWREYDSNGFNSRALIDQLNLRLSPILPDNIADANDRENRLAYFQMSGQDPQHPQNVFTPFNLADELELRASEGANHPWVDSQFERATGLGSNQFGVPNDVNLLRGVTGRAETSEAADQLDNRQLSFDLRHRMTFFSGARNETLPPHLWWESRAPLPRADDIAYGGASVPSSIDDPVVEDLQDRFAEQMRLKLDLREYERPTPSLPSMQAEYGPKQFSDRLSHALMLGLTSGDVTDRDLYDTSLPPILIQEGGRDSYFGPGDRGWERTRRMAAAMTANMLAARDTDDESPLFTMEGYHPLADRDAAVPQRGWFGETGMVPLPIFEHPYDPDTGDLLLATDDLYADFAVGSNSLSDSIDLSDAISRPRWGPGTPSAVLPWDTYDYEHPDPDSADPNNPDILWVDDRLYAGHENWTEKYSPEIHALGVEAQPFIAEAFVAVVGRAWQIPTLDEEGDGGQPPGGGQPGGGGQPPPRYANGGEWIWGTVYDADGGEYAEVVSQTGNEEHWTDSTSPVPPRVVFAVQLLNPYDVPLPLLGRDGQPLYSLRFFRENRLDPESPAKWTVPLDPRGDSNGGGLKFRTASGETGLPIDAGVAGPMIPPATNDRPYSLMIVMNGVEMMENAEANEADRWLDFLDAESMMHPSDDAFLDSRFPSQTARTIGGGELIWMLAPDASNVDELPQSIPSLAKDWYAPGVGGGVAVGFAGPQIDPRIGTAIELVRHHRRDWDQDGFEDQLDQVVGFDPDNYKLEDYDLDVVIDRTVGPDGVDEFAHVVTTQLALHRQPALHDMPGGIASIDELVDGDSSSVFPMEAEVKFAVDAEIPVGGDLPTGFERDGNQLTVNHSWQYPRILGYRGSDEPHADDLGDLQGMSTLNDQYRIPPDKARWMQWARYSRAWATDDWSKDPKSTAISPTPLEAEYATNLKTNDNLPSAARRWRPDRAAPRFVSAHARVTRSWARPWAVRLGTMPNLDPALAYPPKNSDGDPVHEGEGTSFPYHAFPVYANSGQQRVLRNTTWASEGENDMIGPDQGNQQFLGLVTGEDPLLLDQNLPPLTSVAPVYGRLDFEDPPLRLDRRYAEQKSSISASNADEPLDPSDPDSPYWSRWQVMTLGDFESEVDPPRLRDVRLIVVGDPELDRQLPFSAAITGGDLVYPTPYSSMAAWGVAWFSEHEDYNEGDGYAAEAADTYASLLRFRHGNIFHVDWDPDGLGRHDSNSDGDWDTVEDAYSPENPYPYPWATRNARLPWQFDVGTDPEAPTDEYRMFQSAKPSFFAFTPRRNLGGNIISQDIGYDGNAGTFDWSYPDKGWYGPDEIDGDLVMPHGFQVNLKNANFEQVGEVLSALTVAHELYVPMFPSLYSSPLEIFPGGPGCFDWPPSPQIQSTGNFAPNFDEGRVDGIVTMRTFSEGLSELADAGAGVGIGRLEMTASLEDLNAVIGDQPYVLMDLDLEDPANAPPPWYLWSDDPAHFEPDLPAAQRIADLFVCDGPGIYDFETNQDNATHNQGDIVPDGFIDDRDSYQRFTSSFSGVSSAMPRNPAFDNAAGFRGDPTRGMININTAPVEVLRAMPHMYRLVHADPSFGGHPSILDDGVTGHDPAGPMSPNPRSGIPEAMVQYRDGLGKRPVSDNDFWLDAMVPGTAAGPVYGDRGVGEDEDLVSTDEWYDNWQQQPMGLQTDRAIQQSRGTRGFAALGELFQLSRPALYGFEKDVDSGADRRDPLGNAMSADAWRMDWAARNPFGYQDEQVHGVNSQDSQMWDPRDAGLIPEERRSLSDVGAFLSTDTGRLFDSQVPDLRTAEYVAAGNWGNPIYNDPLLTINDSETRYREVHLTGDRVAADAEETSLLFSGISNLITTRSDMFTVHLRVRTFKQEPESGIWDATDPASIVSDERFVMVVDRSNVERPGDRPRILLMDRVDH